MYNPYNWTIISSEEFERKQLIKQLGQKSAELSVARMRVKILEEEIKEIREKIQK